MKGLIDFPIRKALDVLDFLLNLDVKQDLNSFDDIYDILTNI